MTEHAPKSTGLFRSTFIVTFFSILNILAGFFTQLVLANLFGTQIEMDAFLTASAIPSLATTVLLGSLNVTLVPVFIEYNIKKSREEAWRIASGFFNLSVIVLACVVLLMEVIAVPLTRLLAPGYAPATVELSAALLQIMLPNILFSGLSALLAGMSYAHRQFVLPSLAPVINSLCILAVSYLYSGALGIHAVAIGTLLGGGIQLLIYIPWIIRKNGYSFHFRLRHEGIQKLIRLTLPLISTAFLFRANVLIDRVIASTLPEGSVSILGYALKITSILVTISTSGLSISVFPLLSQYAAEGDRTRLIRTFFYGVRLAALITLPIAATVVVLRIPMIEFLLERGQFQVTDTLAISRALIPYLVTMVFMGSSAVLSQGYYVLQDTGSLAKVGIIQIVAYVVYNYLLARAYSYVGIAIAASMLYGMSILVHVKFLSLKLGNLNLGYTVKVILQLCGAAVLSSFLALAIRDLMANAGTLAILVFSAGASFCLYIVIVRFVFKIDDVTQFEQSIKRRLSFRT